MPAPRDLTGLTLGRLTVRRLAETDGVRTWICDCACGAKDVPVASKSLTRGRGGRRSCGCVGRGRSLDGIECALCDKRAHCRVAASVAFCHNHREQWSRWGKPPVEGWIAAYREGRLLACEICGEPFNGYPNRVTCGDECEAEYRRRTALARYYRLPEDRRTRYVEAALERGRERRGVAKVTLRCQLESCGAEFVGFPRQKFHSPACYKAYHFRYGRRCRGRKLASNTAAALDKLARVAENPGPRSSRLCRLCDGRVVGRGLCRRHWNQWRYRGKPDVEEFIEWARAREASRGVAGRDGGAGPQPGRDDDRATPG